MLSVESAAARDAVAKLKPMESDVVSELCAPVSAMREADNTEFPSMTVVAKLGSASIAVVSSSSVVIAAVMSPASAMTLEVTWASVAMTSLLYLGWVVKSH